MSRGVALPARRRDSLPGVVADVCCRRGPVAALELLEHLTDAAYSRASELLGEGDTRAGRMWADIAEARRQDAAWFADAHADYPCGYPGVGLV